MKNFSYVITDEVGVHARPAGNLAKLAKETGAKVTIECNGKSADATRLMAVMALGIKKEMTVNVSVEGDNEDTAFETIEKFFKENL